MGCQEYKNKLGLHCRKQCHSYPWAASGIAAHPYSGEWDREASPITAIDKSSTVSGWEQSDPL